jgi:hypothetical protein
MENRLDRRGVTFELTAQQLDDLAAYVLSLWAGGLRLRTEC